MENLYVNQRNDNLEIVSKILNSVAVKYECGVTYNSDSRTVDFSGNEEYKPLILQETVDMFQPAV